MGAAVGGAGKRDKVKNNGHDHEQALAFKANQHCQNHDGEYQRGQAPQMGFGPLQRSVEQVGERSFNIQKNLVDRTRHAARKRRDRGRFRQIIQGPDDKNRGSLTISSVGL